MLPLRNKEAIKRNIHQNENKFTWSTKVRLVGRNKLVNAVFLNALLPMNVTDLIKPKFDNKLTLNELFS